MSRLILGFAVALAVSFLFACTESSPSADQSLPSATEQQSAPTDSQPQSQQDETQQSEPVAQHVSEAGAEPSGQTQQQQQQPTAAEQPTVEQTQQQAQQAEPPEEAEQPEEPAAPTAPVLRLWSHDGENPSGLFHELITPPNHDPATPLHLVLYLPDRTWPGGWLHSAHIFALERIAADYGVAMLMPYSFGEHGHWNAADGCCERQPDGRDSVAFYRGLIDEARQHIHVDRLSIIGEYAGGWMAYRLACEGLPGLSAIAVLEASSYGDRTRCDGARPISVFHVHPTNHAGWRYLWQGGERMGWNGGVFVYPGAEALVRRWADRAGCNLSAAQLADTLDDQRADTVRLRWSQGCADGIAVELWGVDLETVTTSLAGDFIWPPLLISQYATGVLGWLNEQAQVRDLDELFQPGAEPAPRSIEPGVWTQEGDLEFVVLDTSPPSTLVRPYGTSTEEPISLVIPLPGSHGDVWNDAVKWIEALGAERFAVLLPGQGYRGTRPHPGLDTYASRKRQDLFEQMVDLAQAHIAIADVFISGDSGGALEAHWVARRCMPQLTGFITSAVALAGQSAAGGCVSPNPISVLHRFGTKDDVGWGDEDTIQSWAELAGCDPDPQHLANINVAGNIPGNETEVIRWREGCVDGITVELWRVVGGDHNPWNPNLGQQLVEWMLNEARVES